MAFSSLPNGVFEKAVRMFSLVCHVRGHTDVQMDGEVRRREDLRRRQMKPTTTLFVVNFDVERTRERDLERHFEEYGRLKRVQIKRNYAFIQYETVEQATDALKNTNGSHLPGALPHTKLNARQWPKVPLLCFVSVLVQSILVIGHFYEELHSQVEMAVLGWQAIRGHCLWSMLQERQTGAQQRPEHAEGAAAAAAAAAPLGIGGQSAGLRPMVVQGLLHLQGRPMLPASQ
jgi:hypothetical protein